MTGAANTPPRTQAMTEAQRIAAWPGTLRVTCAFRCADEFGDPPCWEVVPDCAPCADCLAIEAGEWETNDGE